MSISFNEMTCIQMTVNTMKLIRFFCLCIVEVCILSCLGEFCRKKILMTIYTTAFIHITTGNFKPASVFQSNEAESFVHLPTNRVILWSLWPRGSHLLLEEDDNPRRQLCNLIVFHNELIFSTMHQPKVNMARYTVIIC